MKKLTAILLSLILGVAAFAQTSITTPSKDLKLQLRSTQMIGNDVEITVLLTNNSQNEALINLVGGIYQTGMGGSVAYDNDGNVYELQNVRVSVANKNLTDQYSATSFPAGVPVKCHILVKDIAKEATALTKVKLCVLCPQLDIKNTGACFELNNISFR
ncbi:MAG: hypothetical protein IK031_04700 [Bacteroidales bacterium]|nr:hypothetical protein [Bacteroidales bacterium]